MLSVHLRLAEIFHINLNGPLTLEEAKELQCCLRENARYCWDCLMIDNQSRLASGTNDNEWQLDLQRKLEVLRLTGRVPKN
ncbi:hypothetical protein MHH60_02825 [Paenibacillus sp. FSL H7-0716]|uniref:Uncharacterized protein n=1 Tax=Paenibacillus odorifer TaxID=189426 RepID=A0AB36J5W3_9BACL|nr:hypothetical protein [Paenibacillus odorifer]OME10924.1 hypothetical protein BSK47_30135 [Paenibacillus odorifer]